MFSTMNCSSSLRDDVADFALDVGHRLRGVLDSNAAGDAHEKPDQSGVGLREKLAAGLHDGEDPERHGEDHRDQDQHLAAQDETRGFCPAISRDPIHAVLDGVVDE